MQPGRLWPALAPLNIPATLSAESTGLTVTVTLVTQPVQVPAAAASALPQLSYLDLAGTASANGMSGTAVNLSGQSGYLGLPHDAAARHDRHRFRYHQQTGQARPP